MRNMLPHCHAADVLRISNLLIAKSLAESQQEDAVFLFRKVRHGIFHHLAKSFAINVLKAVLSSRRRKALIYSPMSFLA